MEVVFRAVDVLNFPTLLVNDPIAHPLERSLEGVTVEQLAVFLAGRLHLRNHLAVSTKSMRYAAI